MRYKNNEVGKYLEKNPDLKKWINECLCCHKKGYKPEMIIYVNNIQASADYGKKNLKHYFNPLSINEDGLCKDCASILKRRIK